MLFPIKSWDFKILQKKLLDWSKSCVSMRQTKCKNKKCLLKAKVLHASCTFCFSLFLNFFWQNFPHDVSWWTRGWSMRWQNQTFEILFGSRQKVMKLQKANHFGWRGQTYKQHLLFIISLKIIQRKVVCPKVLRFSSSVGRTDFDKTASFSNWFAGTQRSWQKLKNLPNFKCNFVEKHKKH